MAASRATIVANLGIANFSRLFNALVRSAGTSGRAVYAGIGVAVSGVAIYTPYAAVVPTIVSVFFSGRRAALALAVRLTHTAIAFPGANVATESPAAIVVGVE